MKDVKKIVLSRKFIYDVQDANEYRVRQNPNAVREMREKIEKRLELLEIFPELGRSIEEENGKDLRMLIFETYIILYSIEKDKIQIERFLDEKQDFYKFT